MIIFILHKDSRQGLLGDFCTKKDADADFLACYSTFFLNWI